MTFLSAEQILAANDREHEDVDVPEWGGTVRVIGLSAADRDAYEAALAATTKGDATAMARLQNFRAKLVVKALVDADGKRLFSDADAKELGTKSGKVIDRLFDVVRRLSGMGKDALEQGKADSESGQSGSSSTD